MRYKKNFDMFSHNFLCIASRNAILQDPGHYIYNSVATFSQIDLNFTKKKISFLRLSRDPVGRFVRTFFCFVALIELYKIKKIRMNRITGYRDNRKKRKIKKEQIGSFL